jgi:hypothetical protein
LLRLGGLVKGAVRKILPAVGQAFSGLIVSGTEGQTGPLAADASQLLGMEVEGMSREDQEFVAAKQLVRLAGAAAANAGGDASNAARHGVMHAAQLYAPGLLRFTQKHQQCDCGTCTSMPAHSGTCVRHGREFILHGLLPNHSI